MPVKRKAENRGLPRRWQHRHGAYYYQVPPGQESKWDGKKLFRLGTKLAEAHRAWAARIERLDEVKTITQLIDRYSLEYLPTLKPKTQEGYRPAIVRIRAVFGEMGCRDVEAHHANTYFDRVKVKHGLSTARGDIAVLRGLFTQALRWGAVTAHPMMGLKFEQVAPAKDVVEQWQIDAMLTIPVDSRSVLIAQHYIRLKLMTGLRRSDLLTLRLSNLKDDGIHCTLRKTDKTSGKKLMFPWVDPHTNEENAEFRELIGAIKAIPPKRKGDGFLFVSEKGAGFVDERTGRADGFDSLWRRFMTKVMAQSEVTTRIKEKTLRAFVADQADSLEAAKELLGHTSTHTTRRHYRKTADVVNPLKLPSTNPR